MSPQLSLEWGAMFRMAVGMGVSPEAFWRLSLREWRWLCGTAPGVVMDRASLRQLMQQFPDEGL